MFRSAPGTATLAGLSAVAMLLLAACGGAENGPVIGTPAQAAPSAPGASASLTLAVLQQQLSGQLSAAGQTGSDPEFAQFTSEVEALLNDQSLLSSERISGLQQLGSTEATKLEGQLSSLIGQVESDSALTSEQRFDIEEVIRSVEDELQALGAKIAADTLVDVLRPDVINVDSSTRVDAVVQPVVHIAIGAGDVLSEAYLISNQAHNLGSQISSTATNQATESQLLSSIQSDVAAMNSTGSTVFTQVLELTPAGYPGNQATLNTLKTDLTNVENGAAASAHNDVSALSTCLDDDADQQTCQP
ncbi:MAG: hypothetical protein WB802_08795 [Candidatus Dormiibacterota bacterium]|jgi:hypothetical protein